MCERQQSTTFGGIRLDHLRRYLFALNGLKSPVLDAACGTGYGSFLMAEEGHTVTAVDIEREAVDWGQMYYGHPNIQWTIGDILNQPWGEEKFNTIVCFETLEHLAEPDKVLGMFYESLNPGGKLIVSVPNEEKYPFNNGEAFGGDKYPHLRHYTPEQLEEALTLAHFSVIHHGTQLTKTAHVVTGSGGLFLVYTGVKKK